VDNDVILTMRILGIDPGLRTTGFGVIEADGPRLAYVASGTIKTDAVAIGELPARLKIIFDGVREVVQLPAALRLGGDRLRQRQPAEHAAAGPGARRGAGGAGVGRTWRCRNTPRCR
jgi:hypothetical protein